MADQLPKGWVKTTLGDVNVPSRERALPSEAPDLPYVGMEHVESQTMKLLGQGEARSLKSSSVRFNKGDVLYGKMRPYLNKVWLAEFDGLCSAEFLVFPKTEGLNGQLFAYRLNSQDFVNFANHQVSGDRPRVDFEKLAIFPYLLAPSREQGRIVAKLDALLSRVSAGEAAARRALERLKKYRAAVLHAAVTGELTRDWRKTHAPEETGSQLLKRLLAERRARWEAAELKRLHAAGKPPKDDKWKKRYPEPILAKASGPTDLPRGWAWTSVDQLATGEPGAIQSGPFGSQLRHSEFVKRGILAIGIDNVLDGRFSMGRQHRITATKYKRLQKFAARPHDVVITVMATVGRVCVLPEDLEKAILTKHCYRISPPAQFVNSEYLAFTLRADAETRQHIFGNIRGQTRAGINGSILKVAPVPLPPHPEQAQIVREVQYRLAAAGRLTTTLNRQLERASATRQSLLREAFAGTLVPQNPNDEPASVLLERIRAAREAEAKKPKATRMPKSRTKSAKRPLLDVLRESRKPMTAECLFLESGYETLRNESDEPQDVVDAFYAELRELTAKPPKISQQKNSKNQVLLRALS